MKNEGPTLEAIFLSVSVLSLVRNKQCQSIGPSRWKVKGGPGEESPKQITSSNRWQSQDSSHR